MLKSILDWILALLFGKPKIDGVDSKRDKAKDKSKPGSKERPQKPEVPKGKKKFVIIIDPGHGGQDSGAVDPNREVMEKDAALAIALTLKYLMTHEEEPGKWSVVLTRTGDYKPTYFKRTSLAKDFNADVFVSIHFNSPETYGLVYYRAEDPDPKSQKLARVIAGECGYRRLWPSTSSRFGRLYIDDVRWETPAVLVEVDPIDKYEDSKEYRIKKATCILNGLKQYLEEVSG